MVQLTISIALALFTSLVFASPLLGTPGNFTIKDVKSGRYLTAPAGDGGPLITAVGLKNAAAFELNVIYGGTGKRTGFAPTAISFGNFFVNPRVRFNVRFVVDSFQQAPDAYYIISEPTNGQFGGGMWCTKESSAYQVGFFYFCPIVKAAVLEIKPVS